MSKLGRLDIKVVAERLRPAARQTLLDALTPLQKPPGLAPAAKGVGRRPPKVVPTLEAQTP